MTLGERIKNSRKAKKMSQEELGRHLGIGKSTVSEWESGKRPLPIDSMEQIATVLGVSVPALMGWSVDNDQYTNAGELSPAALTIARKYDRLDSRGQAVVSALVDLELEHSAHPYAALMEPDTDAPASPSAKAE